jgi:hypothetical protein
MILIKLAGRNTGAEQSVALEVERLACRPRCLRACSRSTPVSVLIYDRLRDTPSERSRTALICHIISHPVYVLKTDVPREYVSS